MSFEDWKDMMLRKTGQDPNDLKGRRGTEHKSDADFGVDASFDAFGEEGEISLDFESYSERSHNPSVPTGIPIAEESEGVRIDLAGDDGSPYIKSKDAGKTCKERFSFSSFDAGATVLKTSPGARNAKAILVENKDTYMLLECAGHNKYVIVELSDDILIDTIVLANFEFFSSMIRHFRVSVSDRYPVKMEKWKDLGTFEAKNSRDIQPFLVEHPLIWAKYLRIEFLSHYGKEYYCPVSLLRVHGTPDVRVVERQRG
ncbi:MAG: SUN domain-containing protein [Candidatus Saccharibacteria bacterium]